MATSIQTDDLALVGQCKRAVSHLGGASAAVAQARAVTQAIHRSFMQGWYRWLSPLRARAMQDSDTAAIAKLQAFVAEAHKQQMDPALFWIEFATLAEGVDERAYLDDADPGLREAFTDVLAHADDAGFAVP